MCAVLLLLLLLLLLPQMWVEGGSSRALTRACCVHRSACDVRGLRIAAVAMLCTQKQGEMLPKFPEWWVARATPM